MLYHKREERSATKLGRQCQNHHSALFMMSLFQQHYSISMLLSADNLIENTQLSRVRKYSVHKVLLFSDSPASERGLCLVALSCLAPSACRKAGWDLPGPEHLRGAVIKARWDMSLCFQEYCAMSAVFDKNPPYCRYSEGRN